MTPEIKNYSHMKKYFVVLILALYGSFPIRAQVSINADGSAPSSSAMLDVKSSDKGFLPPRLTTFQRNSISLPEKGLVIFNTDCNDLQFYNGGGWTPVGNAGVIGMPASITGTTIVCANQADVSYMVPLVDGATGYNWTLPFGAVVNSGQGFNVINITYGTVGGSICVNAYNNCYKGPVQCLDIFLGSPGSPQAGIHTPAKTNITWNWDAVEGATGYRWNSTNDFVGATDLGNVLTFTETGLVCGTTYTRYLWASNQCSGSQPTQLSQSTLSCINCGGTVTDTRNGKVYNTIAIGIQCWMKENMDIGARINGIADQTNNQIIEKYCQDDIEANCNVYGGLYQWGEVVQYLNGASNTANWNPAPTGFVQGVCPPGWHLPDETEWCTMNQLLDPTVDCGAFSELGTDIGFKLKESGVAHWAAPNAGATNSSNFTALPGGVRYETGTFYGLTYSGSFWTSTTTYELSARFRRLSSESGAIFRSWDPKTKGYSARCLRDD